MFVKKEKTGALSGRWQTTAVSPLGSFFTITCFSKEARSWAKHLAAITTTTAESFRARDIKPPRDKLWPNSERRERRFEVSKREFVKLRDQRSEECCRVADIHLRDV